MARLRTRFAPRRRAAIAAALAVTLAIVLALLLSPGPARHQPRPSSGPPSVPAPAGEQFGANTGLLFNSHLYGPQQIAALLAALRRTGATVARSDAPWEATEPAPPSGGEHRYSWLFDDTVAGSLAAQGLRWLPVVDYSPPWVQSVPGEDHSPPADVSAFAAYARALSERYGPNGSFWRAHPELRPLPVDTYEIWNEPDNPVFWKPSPDPAGYAALYQTTRSAISAAQPGAHVIVGGLTNPSGFLPALLAASPALRGRIDGVAIHPYARTPKGVLDRLRDARDVLRSLTLSAVPLYVTEFGWTTSPPGALDYLPARLRPRFLEQTLTELAHSDCGVSAALLYTWVTPERNPADSQDWFGVQPPDGAASPDTVALTQGLRSASAPGSIETVCGGA